MALPDNIEQLPFPADKYFREATDKKQVVLHHTASGKGTEGDYRQFLNNPYRIATCVIIDYDGPIKQCFSSQYWGNHLGIPAAFLKQKGFTDFGTRNVLLNKHSIAVEIDAWGPLAFSSGKFFSYAGTEVAKAEVTHYPKGFRTYPQSVLFDTLGVTGKTAYYYHRYSEAQLKSLRQLLMYWNEKHGIPLDYRSDMWDISMNALNGNPGIYTHVSYRADKSDCHPQPELIMLLNSLKPNL